MEHELELIELVARVCEELGLPYAIGGSMAAMAYSEYRTTSDIDVVIALGAGDVPRFLSRFPKAEYYHDERAALEAVATGGQFNVVLMGESLKIDVHVAADPVARGADRAGAPPSLSPGRGGFVFSAGRVDPEEAGVFRRNDSCVTLRPCYASARRRSTGTGSKRLSIATG